MSGMEQVVAELHGFTRVCAQTLQKLGEKEREKDGSKADPTTLLNPEVWPEVWSPGTVDEEQSTWPEWSFLFKSYLAFIEEEFMNDLEHVEKDLEQDLKLNDYKEEVQKRAKKLYAYLVSFVKGRPLRIVRSVTDTDGYRAWQGLCREFQPKTRQRELGIIQALVAFPQFEKGKILEGIMKYEKLVGEHERLAGSSLDENLKIATVMRCCPGQLRQHLQLNVKPGTRHAQVRESMVAYEQSTAAWSSAKILEHNQIVPMEVDRIKGDHKGKGKDKGKGKKGSPKGKGDKGKGKGKGKSSFEKGQRKRWRQESRERQRQVQGTLLCVWQTRPQSS